MLDHVWSSVVQDQCMVVEIGPHLGRVLCECCVYFGGRESLPVAAGGSLSHRWKVLSSLHEAQYLFPSLPLSTATDGRIYYPAVSPCSSNLLHTIGSLIRRSIQL